jgi:hypothetical protein
MYAPAVLLYSEHSGRLELDFHFSFLVNAYGFLIGLEKLKFCFEAICKVMKNLGSPNEVKL